MLLTGATRNKLNKDTKKKKEQKIQHLLYRSSHHNIFVVDSVQSSVGYAKTHTSI